MPHTLTITDLNDFEAEHISEILRSYKPAMITKKIEAMVEGNRSSDMETANRIIEWFDEHLEWHESIMAKIVWTKE